ncbi:MAG: hypothetical protein JJU33_14655 [Phycisphaerales bacterium]|nr:hypothetical protein [Phycisphaerales bacterium]
MTTSAIRHGHRSVRRRFACAAAGLLVAATAATAQPLTDRPGPNRPNPGPSVVYRVIDLGTLTGSERGISHAMGMNDRAMVVGAAQAPSPSATDRRMVPFVWTRSDGIAPVLPRFAGSGFASDINDLGTTVGAARRGPDQPLRAFARTGDRPLSTIPTLGGRQNAALGVNQPGMVVGWSETGNAQHRHAFVFFDGRLRDLGTLGGRNSEANDINRGGSVVGWSELSEPPNSTRDPQRIGFVGHAFTGELMRLTGISPSSDSWANAVSETNVIVGASEEGPSVLPVIRPRDVEAVLWSPNALTVRELGRLANTDNFSEAMGVNDRGMVVGRSGELDHASGEMTTRAFLWRNGRMVDLNDLIAPNAGWRLQAATAVNNRGYIAGYGLHRASNAAQAQRRAFLLVPMRRPTLGTGPRSLGATGVWGPDGELDIQAFFEAFTRGELDADLDLDGKVTLNDLEIALQLLGRDGDN